MTMVPMGGNKPSFNPAVFATDENVRHRLRHGPDRRKSRPAVEGQPRRRKMPSPLESHLRAIGANRPVSLPMKSRPSEINERTPNLATGEVIEKRRTVSLDEGPRPDTIAGRPGQAEARV